MPFKKSLMAVRIPHHRGGHCAVGRVVVKAKMARGASRPITICATPHFGRKKTKVGIAE